MEDGRDAGRNRGRRGDMDGGNDHMTYDIDILSRHVNEQLTNCELGH